MRKADAFEDIVRILKKAGKVLMTTHVYPDGDALGTQLALGWVLESMGKEVILFGEEKVSHMYDFLPGSEKIVTQFPREDRFDCAVSVDCGDCYRLGREMDHILGMTPLIVIDHHAGHKDFGTMRWVDPAKAAAGEMVYELITAMEAPLPFEAAYNLYAAIVADTGSFKFSSTTANTFQVAAELVKRGVEPEKVARKLFDNYSIGRLHLLRYVLDTLQLHGNDRIALIHVTREMYEKSGAAPEDTETFINLPRSLHSVKIAGFIKETKDNRLSVSLRSKGDKYDVSAIACQFGGGGHRNAAGFKVADASIEEVRRTVLRALLPLLPKDDGN